MKKSIVAGAMAVCAVAALVMPGFSQADKGKKEAGAHPPVVIAAAATSYGADSNSAVCLLASDCKGFWTPMSKDGGVNEGIYIQFKEPVAVDNVSVMVSGNAGEGLLKPYFDGMTGSDISTRKFRADKARRDEARRRTIERKVEREWGKNGAPYATPADAGRMGEYDGDQISMESLYNSEKQQTLFSISHTRKNYRIKSFFLKINRVTGDDPPRIISIRFSNKSDTFQHIELPASDKAEVSATSVLSPTIAYGPEHLFDSQIDMAWSTDGGKTNGLGQSVNVRLDIREKIQGLMLWNGYQRSEAHYKANGRVRTLDVNGETVAVRDVPGMQMLQFSKPIESDNVTLTIRDIYKGDAYKDVQISEMRFLSPGGRIILPLVAGKAVEITGKPAPLQDRTYASFIQNAAVGDEDIDSDRPTSCFNTSLRLRSNGSFVIYSDFLDGARTAALYEPGVIEGNWEQNEKDQSLRLFGRKYRVPRQEEVVGYLSSGDAETRLPGPRIFQSVLHVTPFNDLTEVEQKNALNFLVNRRLTNAAMPKNNAVTSVIVLNISAKTDAENSGQDINERTFSMAMAALLARVRELNPLFVKSDIYTDLLLPQAQVRKCEY